MKIQSLSIPVCIAALDQMIKAYIRRQPQGQTLFEVPGLASVTHSVNTGAAFSMLSGQTLLLAALSSALLAALCIFMYRRMNLTPAARTAMLCLIGGGAGNLIDRIVFSGVTDYIRLIPINFPVFNLADVVITGSIAVLLLLLLTNKLEKTTGEEHGSDH